MKPSLVAKPPEAGEWIHEAKFDGYRTQLHIEPEGRRMFTSSGIDWTAKYKPLVKVSEALDVSSAIVDGEVIVPDAQGLSDFGSLRSAITQRPQDLYLIAFDLLYINGRDIRALPVEERRETLAEIIPSGTRIQFSEAMPGDGPSVFHLIDQAGLEGIVSKRVGSRYRSGQTNDWLKIKSYAVSEFELLGVEREAGKPAFALMADRATGKYVGSAFITLNREMRERLWKRVQDHAGSAPKGMKRPATQWVKPGIIARVKHLRGEEDLRHASLLDFSEGE
ncbi:RNA ligase family protein [Mesorhizobium sp. ES1-1]|uniref:ATP-dependent DNA ligase n=1 Tax=Mesorhizobium sp. ES1-1 TaxID=2876629 RepID=UPI001CCE4253|nr:ATP-dependent DNA ligase [Mesorhizobium sp. ES1-1]MBZ9674565.1 ATP-dependent DNA ligase [Mesorhizobium sp. ES1-1]